MSFPWLAPLAKNYEQFYFHSIVFSWQPSFASANGTIGIAVDTDYNDDAPSTFQSFIKNHFSEAGLVCAPMSFRYDGRTGALSHRYMVESKGSGNLQTQQGMFVVCAESIGEQSAFGIKKDTPLGYVFAEYDCEFFVPQSA